jgi:hypothetical protein
MSWNTQGISDIFITWRFRLAASWISRQYIHHYFAKIKADFINTMTIRYFGQNMLEWNMGGNFNYIEQYLTFCARIH